MPKCCLCNEEFEGMGNNALPIMDGRCCDNCNLQKVISARLQQQSKEDIGLGGYQNAPIGEIITDEIFYKSFDIQEIDRLKQFQFIKKYWEAKMSYYSEDDFIGKENMALLRAMWKTSFKASLDEAKIFVIEDDIIPLLLHTECEEENLPFPSVFINTKVQIKNRTYFGFHIGSYYTEKSDYRAILTVYSKNIYHNGEITRITIPDFILLQKTGDENLPFRENDYYHKKIRNFVNSFCNFINEPEVAIISYPINPKNNQRRIARGVMPLPEYKNVVIRGRLRIYVDRLKEYQGGIHTPFSYRFWVRGFYRHFFDKKKYSKIYALSDEDMMKAGLTYSNKHKGILRVFVKPFIKGQGILIKQSWEVTE
jgi:hypothetical protein